MTKCAGQAAGVVKNVNENENEKWIPRCTVNVHLLKNTRMQYDKYLEGRYANHPVEPVEPVEFV